MTVKTRQRPYKSKKYD